MLIVVPKFRKHFAPWFRKVLRKALVRPLPGVYVLILIVASASTALASKVGIWDSSLVKDALMVTSTVVFPMTFKSFSFKSGGGLALYLLRDTLGLAALVTFYLDATPLPLVGELILQPIVTVLVVLQAVARTDAKYSPARRLCDVLLILIVSFLITWSTVQLFSSDPDWWELLRSLLFNFWLPLSLLPFFYIFGFYAMTDEVRNRFRRISRPFTRRLMLAFMIGTRLRMSLLARFNPRYNRVADSTGFTDGLRRMHDFREDLARRDREEAERLARLRKNSGIGGLDTDGCHVDRREFDVTKDRLDWIWTCQNGQWEQQGNRYWDHLTDIIVDAEKHGLPELHGFVVEVSDAGQVWRSWRVTPGGAVLGVGGHERRSMFYFQGEAPPVGWPGSSDEWVEATSAHWPPDWERNDETRL